MTTSRALRFVAAIAFASFLPRLLFAQTALILTQSPLSPAHQAKDILDQLYPPGTRIVVSQPPYAPVNARVISEGLISAGSPIISYDGRSLVFAGKSTPQGSWQIYIASLNGGSPRQVTRISGGAMSPALLPTGEFVFSSPVPPSDHRGSKPPQIFCQLSHREPRQLTFTSSGAEESVVLQDGRILFVAQSPQPERGMALFTINNDGTEITAFCGQHDALATIGKPFPLPDKRLVFLTGALDAAPPRLSAEFVRTARPFAGRSRLLPDCTASICSVRNYGVSNLLICASMPGGSAPVACFVVSSSARTLGPPLVINPAWNTIEAVEAVSPTRPMGRLSNMDLQKSTGQILCLDVNESTLNPGGVPPERASKIRITMASNGTSRVLGEIPVQEDGSFMAEVPADVLLGFEALNESGEVLRKEIPSMWVRPGENRSCVGCHAPHNRTPHNHRPLAVHIPVPKLSKPAPQALAKQMP